MSTRSTGFRTNKTQCYTILLEFLGDLCLKVGFCLSVIPFSSTINVISTRNAALVETSLQNIQVEKGNRILQLRSNYLARLEHVLLCFQLNPFYASVYQKRVLKQFNLAINTCILYLIARTTYTNRYVLFVNSIWKHLFKIIALIGNLRGPLK